MINFFYHFSLLLKREDNFVGTHGVYVTLSFEKSLVRGHSITTWARRGGKELVETQSNKRSTFCNWAINQEEHQNRF